LGVLICLWFLNRVHHLGCGPEGTAR
jgi:hypothetical protein